MYMKLQVISKDLRPGRREDAHEFLRKLIESLQKSYIISNNVPRNLDSYSKETTPFNQIFGGYMRQVITCQQCNYVSTKFQNFMDVQVPILPTIENALENVFNDEHLMDYKCDKCQEKVSARKEYKIERPPQVLCIQLKRFNATGSKNGRPVTLARKLNISNHVRGATHIEYKLVSMINHLGPSSNCGHYTSIAEGENGTFYKFDDAFISPISIHDALNTSAYVIFYEMLKTSRTKILSSENSSRSKAEMQQQLASDLHNQLQNSASSLTVQDELSLGNSVNGESSHKKVSF